jgi:gamma-glutamyltranspeptidase/glutathione hydrolase
MVSRLAEHGAPFRDQDFSSYNAVVRPALTTDYHGRQIATVGGGSGGTTLVESLNLLAALGVGALGHNTPEAIHRMTQSFRQAFADRFAYLADPAFIDVPIDTLTDPAYARERAAEFPRDRLGPVAAGPAGRLAISHGLAPSIPDYFTNSGQMAGGSTTHLSVIDANGVAVSITQTLLSLWGSRVVVPGTGILLNNGMMWFDPEPGRPNSVVGGKQPLSNMAPVIVSLAGRPIASLGASGGRRIMNCNAQLLMNMIDHALTMQPAISAPRIDASTAELLVSQRLPEATRAALAVREHRIAVRDERLLTGDFASPVGIQLTPDGLFLGGADPWYMPAAAIGVAANAE